MLEVDAGKPVQKKLFENPTRDRFAIPMPGLPHPRVEVFQVRVDVAADIPDEIVEIPALDPALPCAAEHRVQFSREQAGQVIESNREAA